MPWSLVCSSASSCRFLVSTHFLRILQRILLRLSLRVPVSQLAKVWEDHSQQQRSTATTATGRSNEDLLVLWGRRRFGKAATRLAKPKDPIILILDAWNKSTRTLWTSWTCPCNIVQEGRAHWIMVCFDGKGAEAVASCNGKPRRGLGSQTRGWVPSLFFWLRMAWMKQEISAKPSCLGSNTTYGIEKTHRSSKAFSLLSDIQRHPFFALPDCRFAPCCQNSGWGGSGNRLNFCVVWRVAPVVK